MEELEFELNFFGYTDTNKDNTLDFFKYADHAKS